MNALLKLLWQQLGFLQGSATKIDGLARVWEGFNNPLHASILLPIDHDALRFWDDYQKWFKLLVLLLIYEDILSS